MSVDGVHFVVLAYGAGGEYEALLESLLRGGVAADRILVVHNPSEAGQPPPDVPRGCEVLGGARNLGYAAGMNRGIERQLARGCDRLLALTHDVRFEPGALEKLVGAAERNPGFGVLGPSMVMAGTDTPFSFGGTARGDGSLEHISERPPGDAEIAPCDWIDGGAMLFEAGLLRRIGGFDERLWSYCEDAEICLRASRAGSRVGVVPDARADQAPGGGKRVGAWAYLLSRNGAAYAYRAKGSPAMARTLARALREAVTDAARAGARLLRLRPGPAIEPWARAVGSFRGVIDFTRRRWGPPPPLPGGGDIANLG